MSINITSTLINVIKIPVTSAIKTALDYDAGDSPFCSLFDSSNNLVLPINPDSYTTTEDRVLEVRDRFSSSAVTVGKRRKTIEFSIDDGRVEIEWALEALMGDATATPGQFSGVTLYDYVKPELADRAIGFSTRVGVLDIETLGGAVRLNANSVAGRRLGKGTRCRFIELDRRSYGRIL